MLDDSRAFYALLIFAVLLVSLRFRFLAPRCAQCGRGHRKSASFCPGCGVPLGAATVSRLSAPMDCRAILRRIHRVLFAYIGGFFPLWLLPILDVLQPSALAVLFAAYAVGGAALVVFVYSRLSRCAACGRFVELGQEQAFSAGYCSHCGNRVHVFDETRRL